jgi:hypothetical protein
VNKEMKRTWKRPVIPDYSSRYRGKPRKNIKANFVVSNQTSPKYLDQFVRFSGNENSIIYMIVSEVSRYSQSKSADFPLSISISIIAERLSKIAAVVSVFAMQLQVVL